MNVQSIDHAPAPGRLNAVAELYHHFFAGLVLTVASRRGRVDAAEWVFRLFRHQHHEKFRSSFAKLGLEGLPDAVACAAYHYLSNGVGGVGVEFMRESDRKAWVHFTPPRWAWPGASICGVPSEVSRAMLRGWYAQNGVSLGNPRLGFVCTAQTMDAQYGLAGYFLEYDHDLSDDERLQFRPGELPPRFDPAAAPRLPDAEWPAERLAKAYRNYAMEYLRSGLPRLVEVFGPADATHLARTAGHLVGAQLYRETAVAFGLEPCRGGAAAFAGLLAAIAIVEGDAATTGGDGDRAEVTRTGWRTARGLGPLSPAVFDGWTGMHEGMLAAHDRFLVMQAVERVDFGDPFTRWTIRRRS